MNVLMECHGLLQEFNLVSMVVRILLAACCGGILGTAAVYLTVSCLKPVAYRFSRDRNRFGLYLEVKRIEYLPMVYKLIEEYDGYLSGKEVTECRKDGSCGAVLSIKLPREKAPEELMEMLSLEKFVKDIKFINYNI